MIDSCISFRNAAERELQFSHQSFGNMNYVQLRIWSRCPLRLFASQNKFMKSQTLTSPRTTFSLRPVLKMRSKIPIPAVSKDIQNFRGSNSRCHCELITRLTDLKKALVYHRSHPPVSLKIDWKYENLLSRLTFGLPAPIQPPAQGLRFDVIVISEEGGRHNFSEITQLATLPVESLAATPSFLFLWLPSSDLLEVGRALLQRWGFRRAEDIVWVKTNHNEIERWKSGGPMPSRRRRGEDSTDGVFVRTKEHCLMGIRGTVRRSVLAPQPAEFSKSFVGGQSFYPLQHRYRCCDSRGAAGRKQAQT